MNASRRAPTRLSALLFALLGFLGLTTSPLAARSVTQYGITWTFGEDRAVGQFANGDYWVIGPVTITAIDPPYNGMNNGWEVNPENANPQAQGFDIGGGDFVAARVPSLPHAAQAGESVVKGVSVAAHQGLSDDCYPLGSCLQTAAVLTVLAAPPPDNGATVFRPPYVGASKPFYSIQALRTDLLPSLAPVASTPTLQWVEEQFKRVQLDHVGGRAGRILRPKDNFVTDDPYGGNVGRDIADGALRLMLNDSVSAKTPALIHYVQGGIDRYYARLSGQVWPGGGGYEPAMRLPIVFAAVLLDNQPMKDYVASTPIIADTDDTMLALSRSGNAIWGTTTEGNEQQYWDWIQDHPYTMDYLDPYGYIDGGVPGLSGYQTAIVSPIWKAAALAALLVPPMKAVWNKPEFFDYADRWVNIGIWTQPDPCAPYDGVPSNRGVTYGPDGLGGCILDTNPSDGTGRFPGEHGIFKDSAGAIRPYISDFSTEMWAAYRGASCYDGICASGETAADCPYDCGTLGPRPSAPRNVVVQ